MVKKIEQSIKISDLTELIAVNKDILQRLKEHSEIGDSYNDILDKLLNKVVD